MLLTSPQDHAMFKLLFLSSHVHHAHRVAWCRRPCIACGPRPKMHLYRIAMSHKQFSNRIPSAKQRRKAGEQKSKNSARIYKICTDARTRIWHNSMCMWLGDSASRIICPINEYIYNMSIYVSYIYSVPVCRPPLRFAAIFQSKHNNINKPIECVPCMACICDSVKIYYIYKYTLVPFIYRRRAGEGTDTQALQRNSLIAQ